MSATRDFAKTRVRGVVRRRKGNGGGEGVYLEGRKHPVDVVLSKAHGDS